MDFSELGSNSCSSLLVQELSNCRTYDHKKREFVVHPVNEVFWRDFKETVKEWDDPDNDCTEYEVSDYAYFIIYLCEEQVTIYGDFLLSIGFSRTPSVHAEKTGNDCSIWYAPVEDILEKHREYPK